MFVRGYSTHIPHQRLIVCGYCPTGRAMGGRISEELEVLASKVREVAA